MNKVNTERLLQILIVLCLLALVYGIHASFRETVVVAGDTAPGFTITADNGRTITRGEFGGKLLVLNFWATWCPPCIQEMPSLNEMQKALAPSGVVVLGVSVDQNQQSYRALLDRAKVSFLTARDPEAKISANYGTFKYPETYLINRDGKVVQKIIGPTNWTDPQMIEQIKTLLGT